MSDDFAVVPGRLYVVATPIGHLGDLSPRAAAVLRGVDLICAEDKRTSQRLLAHIGSKVPMRALHDHNEREQAEALIDQMLAGQALALISDAGTPLVSDPGFRLVRAARERGVEVVPVPGPSAVLAALAAAGLPTDRFVFEGFLPAKSGARRAALNALAAEPRTLVFFEAPHRIVAAVADFADLFGPDRPAWLARELTKRFEQFVGATLGDVLAWSQTAGDQLRGEMVLVVGGCPDAQRPVEVDVQQLLQQLLPLMPTKQAARVAAELTGQPRNALYQQALTLKSSE
ncbi:16S rRNA (cytidine(1402)-2'-O)-methyltransferase [Abyssibacter profundi]|uniref:Ribosomal RNA small subunit methyltransferase I n=1 Tax=Abyssibacter profundi TaxID=2182787 RepID=A0A363UMA3_9GAMM|nr:16S rRNA (cytidine(1402)-2'-O)-methyltransferase [Abyssibacter profundi]PWN56552.1 16S rRNA (cytidine(1402)-2'-O)-methyltransferase [Abyssibacter profundi]